MIAMLVYRQLVILDAGFQSLMLAVIVAAIAAYALWFSFEWRDVSLARVRREQVIVVGAVLAFSLFAIIGCVWSCDCDWTNLWCAI